MKKCDCYRKETKRIYGYHPITGKPIGHDIDIGVCLGTKEMEECSCCGDETKCDFYSEVRERAKKRVTVEDAISHFQYGIDHDMFREPVRTYAEMAVEALEKMR